MTDKDIAQGLKGFEAVWKRVGASKSASAAASKKGVKLMPGKARPANGQRHNPRGR